MTNYTNEQLKEKYEYENREAARYRNSCSHGFGLHSSNAESIKKELLKRGIKIDC